MTYIYIYIIIRPIDKNNSFFMAKKKIIPDWKYKHRILEKAGSKVVQSG